MLLRKESRNHNAERDRRRNHRDSERQAGACATINYEIVTRLGPRVPRVPVGARPARARRDARTAPRGERA